MKAKVRKWSNVAGESGFILYLWFPGCDDLHGVEVDTSHTSAWAWNGDLEKPTISPSINCLVNRKGGQCHSFVRDGRWEFLTDSNHALAGQTMDLPDLPDWFVNE